jgi:hypothetical protein
MPRHRQQRRNADNNTTMQMTGDAATMMLQRKQQRHNKDNNFTTQTMGDNADDDNWDDNADDDADINTDNNATVLTMDDDAIDDAREVKTKIGLSGNIKLGCACDNAFVRCKTPSSARLRERRQTLATHIPMWLLTQRQGMRETSVILFLKKKLMLLQCIKKDSAIWGGWKQYNILIQTRTLVGATI